MAPDLLEHLEGTLPASDPSSVRRRRVLPTYDAEGHREVPPAAACPDASSDSPGASHSPDATYASGASHSPDASDASDASVPPESAHLAARRERTRLLREIEAVAQAQPDDALASWLDGLDPSTVPVEILVEAVAASARLEAAAHARTLSLAAALARRPEMEPAWNDDVGPLPRHRSVAADELAMRLGVSRVVANRLVREGQVLDLVLPATGAALASGDLDAAKVSVLVQRLGDLDLRVAEAVEDLVLPEAPERSTAQVRLDVERALREVDPEGAAARHERARTGRRVSRPRPEPDGMASLWLLLAAEDASRVDGVLEHTARAARVHGDPRTLDQLRADGLRDLVVGDVPAPFPRATVEDPGTRHAALADDEDGDGQDDNREHDENHEQDDGRSRADGSGSVDGRSRADGSGSVDGRSSADGSGSVDGSGSADESVDVSAAVVSPADVPAEQRMPDVPQVVGGCACGGRGAGRPGDQIRVTVAASTLLGLDDRPGELAGYGAIDAVTARALAAGGTWRRIVTDPLSGAVLDVGRTRYRPPAALDEHVRIRDRHCAAPGCTVSAVDADLDHTVEFRGDRLPTHRRDMPDGPASARASATATGGAPPLGTTSDANLGVLCRRHHRLKTDGGFRLRQLRPGVYEWVTPAGHRYLTRPGGDAVVDVSGSPPSPVDTLAELPPPF